MTEVERLFHRIADTAEKEDRPQAIHIHGDVGHVLHIQTVQTINLVANASPSEDEDSP